MVKVWLAATVIVTCLSCKDRSSESRALADESSHVVTSNININQIDLGMREAAVKHLIAEGGWTRAGQRWLEAVDGQKMEIQESSGIVIEEQHIEGDRIKRMKVKASIGMELTERNGATLPLGLVCRSVLKFSARGSGQHRPVDDSISCQGEPD